MEKKLKFKLSQFPNPKDIGRFILDRGSRMLAIATLSLGLYACSVKPSQEEIQRAVLTVLPPTPTVIPTPDLQNINGTVVAQLQPTPTETPTPTATEQRVIIGQNEDEPISNYFQVQGIDYIVSIPKSDQRVANNGKDHAGIDHRNPYLPQSAAWLVTADPGHYRVDNLANVTNPQERASIERDIRSGACFAGDDYKDVLTGREAVVPLWENGGGAILTGAYMEVTSFDVNGNPFTFVLGPENNHAWIFVIANGLGRDNVQGTDANRSLIVRRYNPGFTMWQGIPPGMFISANYAAQTITDAHNNYRDRGTSPGQGQDGVENVSILVAKILPEGVAYSLLQHNDPTIKWQDIKPDQFQVLNSNTRLK